MRNTKKPRNVDVARSKSDACSSDRFLGILGNVDDRDFGLIRPLKNSQFITNKACNDCIDACLRSRPRPRYYRQPSDLI
ncbi:hypothetical protein NDA03_04465 [Trichocoleus sp. Lan]|uniref:hypothetical protein n=1 Tax=Cyanophyceae TaxID=3028117 RepID=UPI0016843A76|nr:MULTISPECIES: hypothetical protein [unclassified Coleofasciculus]MBD1839981.1 hypothetical protein [Coleofasciculus sp. FACHB-501]MBD2086648.1 hypothetical protein [Coleofasciculus sp. FACHB-542]